MIFLPDFYASGFPEPVTIADVLFARDRRAAAQKRLKDSYGQSLVSFTLNLPGPLKRSPRTDLLFREGLELLEEAAGAPVHREFIYEKTGLEALYVFDRDPRDLKKICREIEESFPAARLFDLDVFNPSGEKLSGETPRPCLVCGRPARECARSRAHGLDTVLAAVDKLLEDWLPERLGELAAESLETEARLAPKPGLVDSLNSGAHGDMDLKLMLESAGSLRPYFTRCAKVALEAAKAGNPDYSCLMAELKALGISAEETMLKATGGVNTHRGAIYLIGLLTAGLALRAAGESGDAFCLAARLASCSENLLPGSHGEAVRSLCKSSGPRFEAVSGFPLVKQGMETLKNALQSGRDPDSAQLEALLKLMLLCNDSNLLYRGGPEGLEFTRGLAEEILALPPGQRTPALIRADEELRKKRLSPGGSADLLACAIYTCAALPLI